MRHDAGWRLHDRHRASSSADALAWQVVTGGIGGECEGYVPCYANVMNWLEGEYLRRHPAGAHVSEALTRVRDGLRQSMDLVAGPRPLDGALTPATDCEDLAAGLDPLLVAMRAVTGPAAGAPEGRDAIHLAERLAAYCR